MSNFTPSENMYMNSIRALALQQHEECTGVSLIVKDKDGGFHFYNYNMFGDSYAYIGAYYLKHAMDE